jgi:type II secretory pathway component PulM
VPALVLRHPRWRGRRAAAAAVVLAAAALAIALRARQVPARSLDALPEVAAATTFSPAALNTALERSVRDRGLRFEPVDPLLLLAAAPEGRAE